jgi:hypothetical protein
MTLLNETHQTPSQVRIEPRVQQQKDDLKVFKANMKDYIILVDVTQKFYETNDKQIQLTLFVSSEYKEKYLFVGISERDYNEYHKNDYFYAFEDNIKRLSPEYLEKTRLTKLFDNLEETYINWKLCHKLEETLSIKPNNTKQRKI